ncbi:hypothetical protein SDRG_13249 [Saprolegnia diclina VS20]|uniref:Myosin motor domain-containing protein n=1 Tax=Saprolegnia diclina (strain VS20) TaxID=1156394 RepID=T0PUA2_SAPDV|nr:hypothetical protein SDRG_13249 [Saprolegnia diclina VS20]EQC29089.1 hypothetical protein SDRG_13249 [Saprolegnia diclina VS20]|eukprot:XP_008617548.1 hypothetical protein SDRG_13249 [Saprolegnia diclina VS20]
MTNDDVRMEHIQEWIEATVDVRFDGNMWALLKDGQVLCKLANSLNAAIRVNKLKTAFHCKENIQAFISWAKSVGVPEGDLFHVHDLQFEENIGAVLRTLAALYTMFAEEIRASVRVSTNHGPALASSYDSDDDSGFGDLHDSEPDDEPDLYDLSIVRENRSSSKLAAFLKFVPIQSTTSKHKAPPTPEHVEPPPQEIPIVVKKASPAPKTPSPRKMPATPPPKVAPPPEPVVAKGNKFKLSNFLNKAKSTMKHKESPKKSPKESPIVTKPSPKLQTPKVQTPQTPKVQTPKVPTPKAPPPVVARAPPPVAVVEPPKPVAKVVTPIKSKAVPPPIQTTTDDDDSDDPMTPPSSPKPIVASSTVPPVGNTKQKLSAFLAQTPVGKPTIISAPSSRTEPGKTSPGVAAKMAMIRNNGVAPPTSTVVASTTVVAASDESLSAPLQLSKPRGPVKTQRRSSTSPKAVESSPTVVATPTIVPPVTAPAPTSKLGNFLQKAPASDPQRMLANIMMNRVPQTKTVVSADEDDEALLTPPASPKHVPVVAKSAPVVAKSVPQPSPVASTPLQNKLASFMAAVPPTAAAAAPKSTGGSKLAAFLSTTGVPRKVSVVSAPPSSSFIAPSSSFVAPVLVKSSPPLKRVRRAPRSTLSNNWVLPDQRFSYSKRPASSKPFDKEGARRRFLQNQLRLKAEAKHNVGKHQKTANVCAPGMLCYVPDETDTWLLAEVESVDTRRKHVKVKLVEGAAEARVVDLTNMDVVRAIGGPQATEIDSLPLAITHSNSDGVEDMRNLRFLNEPSIMYNLKRRFEAAQPYTYSNDIVIAVNPYQWLGHLYGEGLHTQYLQQPRHNLPPHVYATSTAAYKSMTASRRNQSILVSGESGAGKTETTKILMNHLATVAGGRDDSTIARVINVNPLLESFGNAKTLRNDNSSRFGKFTQLQFRDGKLRGACCETYLLEKSRVVSFAPGERNYHIFYQLLCGLPVATTASLQLHATSSFRYTGDVAAMTIDGIDDAKWMAQTQLSLGLIDLDASLQHTLFEVLAGILHLGNLDFAPTGENASRVANPESLSAVATLLGLAQDTIATACCNRTVVAHRDAVTVPLNVVEANENRDALAKAIYASLFDWLVARINGAMSIRDASTQIGVLDIFGFEDFAHNGFEQFCINYANEKLQQKFVHDVFSTVQDEYTREGLVWDHISYADNQGILDLIEGKLGIINLMNDHLRQPRGTEEALVNKFRAKDNAIISFAKVKRTQFTIRHYAGAVTYETVGFMEKHRDALMQDLLDLVRSSTKAFVVSLFPLEQPPTVDEPDAISSAASTPSPKSKLEAWVKKPEPKPLLEGRKKALPPKTLGSQFKASLSSLMDTIGSTQAHYVRCIKPNAVKSPTVFDKPMVVAQLRSAGVIDAIRISRAGYPARLTAHELSTRYATMLPPSMLTDDACDAFMRATGHTSPVEFQMGKTLVYFKAGVLEELELMKSDFYYEQATLAQKVVLGFLDRMRFRKRMAAALVLQAFGRMALERVVFTKLKAAAVTMQRVRRYYKDRDAVLAAMRARLAAREAQRVADEAKRVAAEEAARRPPVWDSNSALSSPRSLPSPMTSPEASETKGSFRSAAYSRASDVAATAKALLAHGDALCASCKALGKSHASLEDQMAKLMAENARLRRLLVDHSINPDDDDGVYV